MAWQGALRRAMFSVDQKGAGIETHAELSTASAGPRQLLWIPIRGRPAGQYFPRAPHRKAALFRMVSHNVPSAHMSTGVPYTQNRPPEPHKHSGGRTLKDPMSRCICDAATAEFVKSLTLANTSGPEEGC